MNSTSIFHDKTTFEVVVRVKASSSVTNHKEQRLSSAENRDLGWKLFFFFPLKHHDVRFILLPDFRFMLSFFFFFFCYQMLSLVKRYYVKKNQIKVALTSCDKKVYMRQCKKKLYISDDASFFFLSFICPKHISFG
jgi:hypothetical protein